MNTYGTIAAEAGFAENAMMSNTHFILKDQAIETKLL